MVPAIKYFLAIFFFIILFQVSGCIDETNYTVGYINGTVYSNYGFPCSGVNVSISYYPVTVTDHYGKFSLENLQMPYELVISYNSPNSYECIKFLNLRLNAPVINIPEYEGSNVSFLIKVIFPEFKENQGMLLKFVGVDSSMCETIKFPWYGDTVAYFSAFYKPGYTNTNGKLIYLLRNMSPETGNAESYDAFAFKNITLTYGSTTEVIFTHEEVSYNPEDVITGYNIQYPPGAQPGYINSSLHFNNTDLNNDMELDLYHPSFANEILIPILPGLDYKIKTISEYSYNNSFLRNRKWVYTDINEPVNIVHEEPLKVLNPSDNQSNVNDTTSFTVYDNGMKGIYIYYILIFDLHGYRSSRVVTDKNSIKLSDFKSRDFYFYPDKYYIWAVTKYPNYNSIDEFASTIYLLDDRYDYIQASEMRSFKTAP